MTRMNMPVVRAAVIVFVLIAINAAAQLVGPGPDEHSCKDKSTVNVTVSDSSFAVIPSAFVLFRADRAGTFQPKPFLLELQTNSEERATASLPCGYFDFFAAADGFKPHSAKLEIFEDTSSVSVQLDMYPLVEAMVGE